MPLRIIHLATDAIAGMPIRLVQILRRHSSHAVSLIETKHRESYPQDLIFGDDPQAAVDLIKKADIIHFHNNIDLENSDFYPINFRELEQSGTRFVRQFHSVPSTIARKMRCSVESVLACRIPSIVVGQFQERYYPNALVVPNVIPIHDPRYLPSSEPDLADIVFTPSKSAGAWTDRWNTKGFPETRGLLDLLEKDTGCRIRVLHGQSLDRVLLEKQRSYIVLEEMITGSYHLSGLEGLSMGKPTFGYLDSRTDFIMRYLSGATSLPFINVRLEESYDVIRHLLSDRTAGREIGSLSRVWMERYWNDSILSDSYLAMYKNLMVDPDRVKRQKDLELPDGGSRFRALVLPDLVYERRKKKNNKVLRYPGELFGLLTKELKRKVRIWKKGR